MSRKKVDLITGFLGSGKTTFITEYATYLTEKGLNVGIIVNDYGAINVDRLLLEEVLGDRCHLEMVIGGDPDCARRRLKTKLIAMAMDRYDHVIVEPSGIFDVDDFFDLLFEEPLERWYEIGNVFSIVDAQLDKTMSDEARYILASQLSKAGCVLLSKFSEASEESDNIKAGWSGYDTCGEEVRGLIEYLNDCLEQFKCNRRINDIYLWRKDSISEQDFEKMSSAGYRSGEMLKLPVSEDNSFDSIFFFHVETEHERDKIISVIKGIFEDEKAGNVIRLKGFIKLPPEEGENSEAKWLEVNATKTAVYINPISVGQDLFIVIGENLDRKVIGKHWINYDKGMAPLGQ
ncbi:MAG: GTPase (G3E family) [Eubacterium sp.]|nr:GTPase (G3E family) [Eubacterium sp.]